MDLISDSHVPKYAQIADIFRQRIARGIWAQGLRLPANEVLAAEFGVSRVTVRQAVDLLARDGIIEAQQGRGTFVTGSLKQDRWLKVETTLSDLAEVYRDTSPEIINISESRTDAPAVSRGWQAGGELRFHAPRALAQQAALLRDFDLSRRKDIPEISKAFSQGDGDSDPEGFARSAITSARQTLTIGTADLEVAKLLQVPLNSPVAEVRRVFTTADRTVIYLGEVTYRGDFIRIDMDLRP